MREQERITEQESMLNTVGELRREPIPAPSHEAQTEQRTMCEPETRNQALQQWEVNIRFLSVGCVVTVGCKTIGFNDVDEAMRELTSYVSNPMEEREKWNKLFNS